MRAAPLPPLMPTFTHESTVDAPLDEVWAFHDGVDGLLALTPGFLHLNVEHMVDEAGEPTSGPLEPGDRVSLAMRPFGILPTTRWTSRIVDMVEEDGRAEFVDEMLDGPFAEWIHTHSFEAAGDTTICRDRVDYRPSIWMGDGIGWPGVHAVLAAVFRYRHRELTRRLE